jgi:hypothetical protein
MSYQCIAGKQVYVLSSRQGGKYRNARICRQVTGKNQEPGKRQRSTTANATSGNTLGKAACGVPVGDGNDWGTVTAEVAAGTGVVTAAGVAVVITAGVTV